MNKAFSVQRPAGFSRRPTWLGLASLLLLIAVDAFAGGAITAYSFSGDVPSRSFCLFAGGTSVPVVEMPAMTAEERRRLAVAYSKLPSYCHIDDPACMHLHYAHLAAAGEVEIDIRSVEEIKECRIHPLEWNIPCVIRNKRLLFKTEKGHQPRYYVVRINQLPPLMVAVDPPEPPMNKKDPAVVDASSYLTDASGLIEQTDGFQRAFEDMNGSGKTLYVPPGIYLVDQLSIRAGHDFTIYLAPGCLLKVKCSTNGENMHRHGLWLDRCRNVTISGRGGIDHQAYENYVIYGNNYQHGMIDYYTSNPSCPWITQSPLFLTGCRCILIEGITIRNGRNFNINARQCDSLTIRGVKIFTPPACTPEYADGINTASCWDVWVDDCLVACNDDCFASGHYFASYDVRPSRNHNVNGMLGWNMRANAIRLGFYTDHDQGDFIFQHCRFISMPYGSVLIHGLRPKADGSPARYGAIRLIDCSFDNAERLRSLFRVERAGIDSLELRNVTFFGRPNSAAAWQIEGDAAAPIRSLRLENVRVNHRRVEKIDTASSRLRQVESCTIE